MTDMPCVELRVTFGKTYRISWDESYDPSHIPQRKRDRWAMQLSCRGRGVTIYPHGGETLAVEVNGRPGISRQLAHISGVSVHQDGGYYGDMTFLFPLSLFEAVATIVKPRLRRTCNLSEEQRRAASDRLRKMRASHQKATVDAQERVQAI